MKFLYYLLLCFSLMVNQTTFAHTSNVAPIITNPQANFTDTTFTFSYQVPSAQTYYRVYVDNTRDPNTGYYVGQIGAKFLLQNGNLYSYVGPGWKWKIVKPVSFNVTNNIARWTLSRTDMGDMNCGGAFDYAFQIVNGSVTSAIPKQTLCYTSNPSCVMPPAPRKQQVAVAAYFYPDCSTNKNCYWAQLDNAIPRVGVAVINPDLGPGQAPDQNYVKQVQHTQSKGAKVLGYVYTNEGARSLTSIESDIDKYYTWYGVDGIFFDNAYASDCNMLTYYQTLNQYVKRKSNTALTIMKYGTDAPECYADVSDVLINFDDTYSRYVSWKPAKWVYSYPEEKFWHIVTNTPMQSIENAVVLAKMHNGGYVYVTPEIGQRVYTSLPTVTYWNKELDSLN